MTVKFLYSKQGKRLKGYNNKTGGKDEEIYVLHYKRKQ